MSGSRLLDDKLLDRWSAQLDCVAASVEYRLAPEHPYPTPIEDCYAAHQWLLANAAAHGIDPHRTVIGGISAGGGLAAALALMLRDRGAQAPLGQILISPMIDAAQANPTHAWNVPIWPKTANAIGWNAYVGANASPAEYAAPMRAKNLANLPRAYVAVGSAEVFLDESIAYARRLIEAGNLADLHVLGGAPHGFETLARDSSVTRLAFAHLDAWLANVLASSVERLA